jgi:hypothetical protein
MAWAIHQQYRLGEEWKGLKDNFQTFTFKDPAGAAYVHGFWVSNQGAHYELRIPVPPGYPDECPSTYITYPAPLRDYTGMTTIESYGTSHEMHVWKTDRPGWVKICTYRPEYWSADNSMVKIIRKALLWIVAYECHLQDGSPIKKFLLDA